MPLNPSIILGSNPVPDPVQNYAKILQLRNLQAQGPLIQQQIQAGQQEAQSKGLQIQQQQQTLNSQKALDDAMKGAITTNPDGTPSFNREAVTNHLTQAGYGHLVPGVIKQLGDSEKSFVDLAKAKNDVAEGQQKIAGLQTDALGSLGLSVKAANYDPQAAVAAVAFALAHKSIDQQAALDITQKIQANPTPDNVKGLVEPLIAASPKAQESLKNTAQANNFTATTNKTNALLPGEVANQGLTNTKLTQETTGTTPLSIFQGAQLKQGAQRIGIQNSELGISRARLGVAQYAAGLGTDNKPLQGSNLTGDAFLATLPIGLQNKIKAIAEGREPIPTGRAAATGQGKIVSEGVTQYDPQFSTQRAQIRSAFTTGTDGRNIGALNTAVVHLDQYIGALDALKHGTFKPGNALYDSWASTFGSAPPTSAAAISNAVAGETASALKGNATDQEIAAVHRAQPESGSPDQIADYGKSQLHVLGAKLNTYQERYSQQIPNDKTYSPVLPSARAVFQKNGVNPTAGPAASGGQGVTVKAPNGKSYAFKSQADADAFKKSANIQ